MINFFQKHLFLVTFLFLSFSLPAEEAEAVHYASNIVPPCTPNSKNGSQSSQQAGGLSGSSSSSAGGSTANGQSTGANGQSNGAQNSQGSSSSAQNSGSGSSSSTAQNSGGGASKFTKSLTNRATSSANSLKNSSCSTPPNPSSFSVSATYGLLQVAQEGLAFALTAAPTADSSSATTLKVVNPKTPWRSALSVAFGGAATTSWEVDLNYTLLLNQNNSVQTISAPAAPYTNISFLWNNTFNRLDLTLSRPCNTGCCLPFFPFIGLLTALESQNFKSTYDQPNGAGSTEESYWNNKQNWWAIGPYAGGEFVFAFIKNFLFVARSGVSVALSNWRVTSNLLYTPDINAYPLVQDAINVSDSYFNLSTMFDFVLGFRFQVDLTPGKPFGIQIDWRGQIWPNHLLPFNYLFDPSSSTVVPQSPLLPVSDLTMQGVAATMGVAF